MFTADSLGKRLTFLCLFSLPNLNFTPYSDQYSAVITNRKENENKIQVVMNQNFVDCKTKNTQTWCGYFSLIHFDLQKIVDCMKYHFPLKTV